MTNTRPRLLDLFCCAGGAGMGYHRAGFNVVGVDIEPQPRYPFEFHEGDALEYLAAHGHEFDAIHASPPCQGYSNTQRIMQNSHPLLIGDVRDALQAAGKPYVIENVVGAPLLDPVQLVGTMFSLGTMRPRLFECSFPVPFLLAPPAHTKHTKMGRRPKAGEFMHVVGHFSDVRAAQLAMGIDWMTGDELREAIPPAYTEFIGRHLLAQLALPLFSAEAAA